MKVKSLFLAISLAAGVLSLPASAESGPTLGQFRQYYTPSPDEFSKPLHHWLTGYSEPVGIFYVTLKMDKSSTPFCLPDRYDLRGGLPALIQQFEEKSKKSGVVLPDTYPLAAAAFAALSSTFPCDGAV